MIYLTYVSVSRVDSFFVFSVMLFRWKSVSIPETRDEQMDGLSLSNISYCSRWARNT